MNKQKIVSYAFWLLSRKLFSRKELFEKIVKKYPDWTFEEFILIEKDLHPYLLNDKEFCIKYLEYYTQAKLCGKWYFYQKLIQKGIDKEIFEEVWQSLEVDEYAILTRLLEHKQSASKNTIYNFIIRRGFSHSLAAEVLAEEPFVEKFQTPKKYK